MNNSLRPTIIKELREMYPSHIEILTEIEGEINKRKNESGFFEMAQRSFYDSLSKKLVKLEGNGDAADQAKKMKLLFGTEHRFISNTLAFLKNYFSNQHHDSKAPFHYLCLKIEHSQPDDSNSPIHEGLFNKIGKNNFNALFKPENHKALGEITEAIDLIPDEFIIDGERVLAKYAPIKIIRSFAIEQLIKKWGIDYSLMSKEEIELARKIMRINDRFKEVAYKNVLEIINVLKNAQNSDNFLPNVMLTSEEIGLGIGLVMKKLAHDDVNAAMFGYFTGCCQRIGSQGEICAKHSIESKYGGVYVICNGKGVILAGSWAWYDPKRNAICFDSIEISDQASKDLPTLVENQMMNLDSDDIIEIFYTEFAQRLAHSSQTNCRLVKVGMNGNTPENVGHIPLSESEMARIKPYWDDDTIYTDYRDSKNRQHIIYSASSAIYSIHKLNIALTIRELMTTPQPNHYLQYAIAENYEYLEKTHPDLLNEALSFCSDLFLKLMDKTTTESTIHALFDDIQHENIPLGLHIPKTKKSIADTLFQRMNETKLLKFILGKSSDELNNILISPRSYGQRKLPTIPFLLYITRHWSYENIIPILRKEGIDTTIEDEEGNSIAYYFDRKKGGFSNADERTRKEMLDEILMHINPLHTNDDGDCDAGFLINYAVSNENRGLYEDLLKSLAEQGINDLVFNNEDFILFLAKVNFTKGSTFESLLILREINPESIPHYDSSGTPIFYHLLALSNNRENLKDFEEYDISPFSIISHDQTERKQKFPLLNKLKILINKHLHTNKFDSPISVYLDNAIITHLHNPLYSQNEKSDDNTQDLAYLLTELCSPDLMIDKLITYLDNKIIVEDQFKFFWENPAFLNAISNCHSRYFLHLLARVEKMNLTTEFEMNTRGPNPESFRITCNTYQFFINSLYLRKNFSRFTYDYCQLFECAKRTDDQFSFLADIELLKEISDEVYISAKSHLKENLESILIGASKNPKGSLKSFENIFKWIGYSSSLKKIPNLSSLLANCFEHWKSDAFYKLIESFNAREIPTGQFECVKTTTKETFEKAHKNLEILRNIDINQRIELLPFYIQHPHHKDTIYQDICMKNDRLKDAASKLKLPVTSYIKLILSNDKLSVSYLIEASNIIPLSDHFKDEREAFLALIAQNFHLITRLSEIQKMPVEQYLKDQMTKDIDSLRTDITIIEKISPTVNRLYMDNNDCQKLFVAIRADTQRLNVVASPQGYNLNDPARHEIGLHRFHKVLLSGYTMEEALDYFVDYSNLTNEEFDQYLTKKSHIPLKDDPVAARPNKYCKLM